MKISILLPYKENFSPDYPGAVSLFIYETTKQIAQVKTAANLVHEIFKNKTKEKTAIILPNQELLRPLISSLPASIDNLSLSISNP